MTKLKKLLGYDSWKTETPYEEPEGECSFCGEPTDDKYCSRACYMAEIDD